MPSEAAPNEQHDHRPGEVIAGRYVLRRKLGEGGMGVVWIAHSRALDVEVALKMLRRELAGTAAVERMAREARTAAQLGHPALVRVLDFGTSELGQPFVAMELLEGEELHARLAREKRIGASNAVALLLPIIDGLGTAHEKGIVHRDVKPENIFIAKDQQGRVQPKVLDFGIAKLGRDNTPSRLTQVGAVMGSPYYLSPEQAEGLDDIDFRSDIWAIGVVLYEIITGTPPFDGPNYNALLRSVLRDTPKPITEHAVGDRQLWTIIERCLRKDRDQRWGSMWELGEALALWLFEQGVRVDASSRSLRHGWLEGRVTGLQILVPSAYFAAGALIGSTLAQPE
jgi:serine/threonine-protein kinase